MISLVVLVLLAALLAAGIAVAVRFPRRSVTAAHDADTPAGSQVVRRFFQYLLLAGLLITAGTGVTGLLGRLLDIDGTEPGESELALQLSFVLIALPLWVALAWWTRSRATADPSEHLSREWAAYLTVIGLVSLIAGMVGWYGTLTALIGAAPYSGSSVAMAVVWTTVWVGHRLWGRRTAPPSHLRVLVLVGALIGLATAADGLAELIAAIFRGYTGMGGRSIVFSPLAPMLRAAAVLVVGAAAWVAYWLRDARRGPRTGGWLSFVLLAGVGGGLVSAISMLSTLVFEVLVWLVGDPGAAKAAAHFADAPELAGTGAVGLLAWWYHQAVLDTARATERTEVRRVYEYLMAAIGLLAATAGVVLALVTVIEAIVDADGVPTGRSAVNTLLAALVLLVVGIPVWWWHWRMAQRARVADPTDELASISRRTYLLLLFGVAGIAAVIALITLVYLVLQDALDDGVGAETLVRIRYALGILLATSLIAGYHWTVFRVDRRYAARKSAATAAARAPRRSVLVVGDLTADALGALAHRADAEVQLWRTGAPTAATPTADDLARVIDEAPAGDLVVLALDATLRALPATRPKP